MDWPSDCTGRKCMNTRYVSDDSCGRQWFSGHVQSLVSLEWWPLRGLGPGAVPRPYCRRESGSAPHRLHVSTFCTEAAPDVWSHSESWTSSSHCGHPGLIPAQCMWDLWWTKWYWDRLFSEYIGFPQSESFYHWATPIFICMLLLRGQTGKAWELYKRNAVKDIGVHWIKKGI